MVGCTSLVSVLIPSSVTVISDSAFLRCTSLVSVLIPDTTNYMNDRAFDKCPLKCINMNFDVPRVLGFKTFPVLKQCTSTLPVSKPTSLPSFTSLLSLAYSYTY